MRVFKAMVLSGAGLALSGCIAAVPVAPTYTVIPGQGKTEATLRADDAVCREPVPVSSGAASTGAASTQAVAPVTEQQYYGCMASRGEAVIQQQVQPYPVYSGVPYAYPAYAAYPYGYGYPYGGYGAYPYGGGYFGPYVGFGVGFGYGGFYGGRGYGGRGYGGRGYGGYHGGGWGGYHGGGGFRR